MDLELRTRSEQDAYMAGQRSALKLAREKGIEYAEQIIHLSQKGIIAARDVQNPPKSATLF